MEVGNNNQPSDGSSSDEYLDEARDAVRSLRSREIIRTRSMSPNHFSARRKERIRKSNLAGTTHEAEMDENPVQHLEDLPPKELEGAPPGWGSRQRMRKTSRNSLNVANKGRRSSALPTSGPIRLDIPRSSVTHQRRNSQMTFEEWNHLKKLQEIHDAALRARHNEKDAEEPKNIRRNISYEEWVKATEERTKRDVAAQENKKLLEELDKEALENAKYKRRMSFDEWKITKDAAKFASQKKENSLSKDEHHENDARRKKAEEAHRKWIIKKEVEEIKKDREMLLRMQNASLNIGNASPNSAQRRGSWVDNNAALQVQTNRAKVQS